MSRPIALRRCVWKTSIPSACDYIALGHHHAALDVSGETTAAAYCGSPTDPFGIGETYAIVDLTTDEGTRVEIHTLL